MRSPERERSDPGLRGLAATVAVALFGLALILSALAFDAVPLFVPGFGFMLLGLLAPAWVAIAVRTARVEREIGARHAIEDEPLEATVVLRRGLFGLPGGELHDPLAGTPISVGEPLSLVSGRARVQLRIVARIHRRGRHRFAPPSLAISDPLGLVRMTRAGDGQEEELLVLPRTERVRWLRPEHRRAPSGPPTRSLHEPIGAVEVDGLRAYMPGTPASRIHWPALARYPSPPTLLERRLVSEPHTLPLIALDPRVERAPDAEQHLDAAVRAAASLTLELARAGGCSLLLPGERVPTDLGSDLSGWPVLHARLALVEAELDPRRGPALVPNATRGSLIYVAARHDPRGSLPAAAARAAPLILVLPVDLRGGLEVAPSFTVSGCAGFLVRQRASRSRRRIAA